MSTHRSVFRKKGSARPSVLTCAGGWLIALQLWLALSSSAFAAPLAPQALSENTPYNLARAGGSVVRLLVTYKSTNNPDTGTMNAAPVQVICSGLGVIVASWPTTQPNQVNTWVLTDSDLVVPNGPASCAGNHPEMSFQDIQFVTSDFYNAAQTITFSTDRTAQVKCLGLPSCPATGSPVSAPVLIGFSNRLQGSLSNSNVSLPAEPFIDVATSSPSSRLTSLALGQGGSTSVPKPVAESADPTQLSNYLQTTKTFRSPVVQEGTANLEPGMPIIDQNGELTAIRLRGTDNLFTPMLIEANTLHAAITDFAKTSQNTVHTDWNNGLNSYYVKKDFTAAKKSFDAAARANPKFNAASQFSQFAVTKSQQGADSNPNPDSNAQSSIFLGMELWQIGLLGLAGLLILLGIVTVLLRRTRSRMSSHSGFTPDELAEAERQATLDAQRYRELEKQQTLVPPPPSVAPMQGAPVSQQSPVLTAAQARGLHCPNCNSVVPHDANFCPNCRMWLSPSESGLHLRVVPQQSAFGVAPAPAPSIAEMPTMLPPSSPPPPPPAVVPAPANQPALAEQPTIPVGMLKTSSLAEVPTVEMKSKGATTNLDSEKTQPYAKKSNGTRLGFIVGTRSDPGIKRQYKPNEDSLFAAQGVISAPNPQPFGLFVVADGMGGHANGQDASRLAIQTIVEYILPRLIKGGIASPAVYTHLLAEGIQSANEAVQQRNMDQRGDMGTTVTGALLVESTAYVSNVGDSRTYLYRESQGGLTKITNDHSVVASLVEAGIIKPDDIYTHPKRSHIYRSLGEKASVEVDNFTVPLQEGDKLLLCSDGLWDMVRDPQIEEVVKAPHELKTLTENLIQAAYAGGGDDNVSVIVVQIAKASKASKGARLQVLAMPDNFQMPPL